MFYPQIGSILGMIGSIAGLFIVYVLPTITYLKQVKTECEHPILANAIKKNMYEIRVGQQPQMSPRIVIDNAVLESKSPMIQRRLRNPNQKPDMSPFYKAAALHSVIIIYGVLILFLQFFNPFNGWLIT